MYGKNSCQAFRFLILLLFSSLTVLATITLNVIGDVTAGLSHEVQWTRDPKDTDTFFLFKFNLDAKGKDKINTTGITVASSGLLSGTSQMLFIKPKCPFACSCPLFPANDFPVVFLYSLPRMAARYRTNHWP
ncbi:hypothetical protein C8J56DRAFT_211196 [Mycena floridula]|nr:hypothetical protein C8J56DRAFT_211196 [Mycena floridula]